MDVGDTIAGRYQVRERIGSGGMGVVWRALDTDLDREVAVKQAIVEDTRRLRTEARTAAGLAHPHIVMVYDVLVEDASCWLVMEYVPSRSLAEIVRTDGPLALDKAAAIGSQIADALAEVHDRGIVHGDVTPHNILVMADGTAKLTDFGVSRALWSDVTQTASAMIRGKPPFLAPEVARGGTAQRESDMFSLGATLFYAVEGRSPLGDAENPMTQVWRSGSGHIDRPQNAGELTALLTQLLDKKPKNRPTASDARRQLEKPSAVRSVRRRRTIMAGTAIVTVLLVVAGVIVLRPGSTAAPNPPAPEAGVDYERSLDPCALVSTTPLIPFGEPVVYTDYGNFDHCDVNIIATGAPIANLQVQLTNSVPEPAGWTQRTDGSLTVLTKPQPEPDDECVRVVIVDQRVAIKITGERVTPKHPDLCGMADAGTAHVIEKLKAGPIPRRPVPPPATSLAWLDVCKLVDPQAVRQYLGPDAGPSEPGFGSWSCFWRTRGDALIFVRHDRDAPVRVQTGSPAEFAGRQGVLPEIQGVNYCRAKVEYRPYLNPAGRNRAEQVFVEVLGHEPPVPGVCETTKQFAATVAERLPK